MIKRLTLNAEKQAQKAQKLPAFDGINLLHIKRRLEELLALIGREGIFDEYTKHDISHVDEAIGSLDWLIPPTTANRMTPADWLLVVLAVYFHDVGMLVTKTEYAERNASGFPDYRDRELYDGEHGADYKAKVEQLEPDAAERFLYQEFVRHHHAGRIRNWVQGRAAEHLGVNHEAMRAVDQLLAPLGAHFRQDLALVCESHHLDDLQEFRKYRVSQPYGNSDEETANVHYAALLLRAADLLHITSDRAPSIAFKVIAPLDPISQVEWAKQMGVLRVRPKLGLDREGHPDESAPRDTVEVHALYTQENGFFGLTAYLAYVGQQLAKCHDWARAAKRTQASPHEFPWRYVDDSQITTEGFIRETFEFTIEQPRILDLLTGHTLYNDTSVVLRELVQNALDAVRLQHHIAVQDDPSAAVGTVRIHWDSEQRWLSVEDDGTGMTQDTIERHLLRIAASLYQEPEFKKRYPEFSPISQFGIGILATFMIADEVEIITVHPDEEQARKLSLRSVHGRYLVRLLDKWADETAKRLTPHGTLVRVKVRPSADMPGVIEAAKRWVVIPGCQVVASADAAQPESIGFASPKDALRAELQACGLKLTEGRQADKPGAIRVDQRQIDGVTLAYAVQWSEYFRDWAFLQAGVTLGSQRGKPFRLGTCVEGIRVEDHSPGFNGHTVLALGNCTGPSSPGTNVARSGLEATPSRAIMLQALYSMYCAHVAEEMEALHTERGFCTTWAAEEAKYLVDSLLSLKEAEQELVDEELLIEAVRQLPLFVVESEGQRRACSAATLASMPAFWTVDCRSTRSAEVMIREARADVSLSALLSALGRTEHDLPAGPLLCGIRETTGVDGYAFSGKEVRAIHVERAQRRVDAEWVTIADHPRWQALPQQLRRGITFRPVGRPASAMLAPPDIEVTGLAGELVVRTLGISFYVPGTRVWEYFTRLHSHALGGGAAEPWLVFAVVAVEHWGLRQSVRVTEEQVRRAAVEFFEEEIRDSRLLDEAYAQLGEPEGLVDLLNAGDLTVFDPLMWSREKDSDLWYGSV